MDQTQFPWRPLGVLLAERGLLTEGELEDALDEQQRSGRLLGEILVGRGYLTGWTLTRVLTEQHGVELLSAGGAEERPGKDAVAQPPQAQPTPAGAGTAWRPLGRLLVETGVLEEAELKDALAEQARGGRRLGEVLVSRGSVSGDALARALAAQHGVELEPTEELEATIKPPSPGEPVYQVCAAKSVLYESTNFLEAADFAFEFVERHEPDALEIERRQGDKRECVWMYSQDRAAEVAASRKGMLETYGFDPNQWDAGRRFEPGRSS
ncbi:MAG: hypothetical protein WAQ33_04920 [Gaiellaceae bacterium]